MPLADWNKKIDDKLEPVRGDRARRHEDPAQHHDAARTRAPTTRSGSTRTPTPEPANWWQDRADAGNLYLRMRDSTVPHEFGHLIGLPDEYQRTGPDFKGIVGETPTGPDEHLGPDRGADRGRAPRRALPGRRGQARAGGDGDPRAVGLIVGGAAQAGRRSPRASRSPTTRSTRAWFTKSLVEAMRDKLPEEDKWTIQTVVLVREPEHHGRPGRLSGSEPAHDHAGGATPHAPLPGHHPPLLSHEGVGRCGPKSSARPPVAASSDAPPPARELVAVARRRERDRVALDTGRRRPVRAVRAGRSRPCARLADGRRGVDAAGDGGPAPATTRRSTTSGRPRPSWRSATSDAGRAVGRAAHRCRRLLDGLWRSPVAAIALDGRRAAGCASSIGAPRRCDRASRSLSASTSRAGATTRRRARGRRRGAGWAAWRPDPAGRWRSRPLDGPAAGRASSVASASFVAEDDGRLVPVPAHGRATARSSAGPRGRRLTPRDSGTWAILDAAAGTRRTRPRRSAGRACGTRARWPG